MLPVIQFVAICVVLRLYCNFRIQDLHWKTHYVSDIGNVFLYAVYFSCTLLLSHRNCNVPISFFFLHSSVSSSRPYLDLCYFSLLAFSSLTFFCPLFHLFFCMILAVSCAHFFKFLQFVLFQAFFSSFRS